MKFVMRSLPSLQHRKSQHDCTLWSAFSSEATRLVRVASWGIGGISHQVFLRGWYQTPCLQGTKNQQQNSTKTKKIQNTQTLQKTKSTNPTTKTQRNSQMTDPTTKTPHQSHIRFTQKQYEQLQKDCALYKQSIPERMKEDYFGKPPIQPFYPYEDALAHLTELKRIGNNVNQIARQINAGIREGFYPVVEKIYDAVMEHFERISKPYGNR